MSLSVAIDRDNSAGQPLLQQPGWADVLLFLPHFLLTFVGREFFCAAAAAAADAAAAAASAAVEGRNAATARRLPGVARSPVEVEVLLPRSVVLGAVHVACGSQF